MTKQPDEPLNEDQTLFRNANPNTRPLKSHAHNKHVFQKSPKARLVKQPTTTPTLHDSIPPPLNFKETVGADTPLLYATDGISYKLLQKLKRGQIMLEAELDLHRNTSTDAWQRTQRFIRAAQQQRIRAVRIIHGKGQSSLQPPVLKNCLNEWLRDNPSVLAFCSALPKDGGTGAIYVLLKLGKSVHEK